MRCLFTDSVKQQIVIYIEYTERWRKIKKMEEGNGVREGVGRPNISQDYDVRLPVNHGLPM